MRRAVFGTAGAVLLLLSGCAGGDRAATAPSMSGLPGPWAEDFAQALANDPSAYERAILEDGRVTVDEVADAHAQIGQCMKDGGYTITYGADGGSEIGSIAGVETRDDVERGNGVLEACQKRFDRAVTFLYEQTRRNPEKLDDATITVRCLRRAGLVPSTYSAQRWRHDHAADRFPFDEHDAAAQQCRLDPLGLWRDG